MSLTDKDKEAIFRAISYWSSVGKPENNAELYRCLDGDRLPPANLLTFEGEIKPEKTLAVKPDELKAPPRVGKGATKDAWDAFVLQTMEVDPVVVDALSRDDLIEMAVERGVIPKTDPKTEKKPKTT